MLGTTFGGNHLACSAGIAVLEVLENEHLMENASEMGGYLMNQLSRIPEIKEVRGKGLMIGIELETDIQEIRKDLLFNYRIFTGAASNPKTLRILPPLSIGQSELDYFVSSLKQALT